MTRDAFHYYLPAYLINFGEDISKVPEIEHYVIPELTPPHLGGYDYQTEEDFKNKYQNFTLAQKNAIRDFLKYRLFRYELENSLFIFNQETMANEMMAEVRALQNFWSNF